MDLKMDDLDGLEATRRLARDPATAAIPVIAVTASAFGNGRQTARDAGCVDYLSKPVRAQLLFGMLQTHLGVRFVSGGDQPAPRRCARDRPGSPRRGRRPASRARSRSATSAIFRSSRST